MLTVVKLKSIIRYLGDVMPGGWLEQILTIAINLQPSYDLSRGLLVYRPVEEP